MPNYRYDLATLHVTAGDVVAVLGELAAQHDHTFAELAAILDDDTVWRDAVIAGQLSRFEMAVWLILPSTVDLGPDLFAEFQRELRAAATKAARKQK